MNQKIIIIDDFYDLAFFHHQAFGHIDSEITSQFLTAPQDVLAKSKCNIEEETYSKISSILNKKSVKIDGINCVLGEDNKDTIVSNIQYDWIAVIYLTLPTICSFNTGLKFYKHIPTNLDSYPDKTSSEMLGLKTTDEINNSFDFNDRNQWKKYTDIYLKYNRAIIFKADLWHSYGDGFGNQINNSMIYQTLFIANGK